MGNQEPICQPWLQSSRHLGAFFSRIPHQGKQQQRQEQQQHCHSVFFFFLLSSFCCAFGISDAYWVFRERLRCCWHAVQKGRVIQRTCLHVSASAWCLPLCCQAPNKTRSSFLWFSFAALWKCLVEVLIILMCWQITSADSETLCNPPSTGSLLFGYLCVQRLQAGHT